MFHIRSRLFSLLPSLVASTVAFYTTIAFSEDIPVYGVRFPVDSVLSTGAGYSTVSIGSVHELIEEKNLHSFVAHTYFSDRELFRRLALSDLRSFVLNALKNGDSKLAADALAALFEYGDPVSKDAVELFEQAASEGIFPEACSELFMHASLDGVSPRIVSICLVTIARRGIDSVHQHFSKLLYANIDSVRTYLREKLLYALHEGSMEKAQGYAALMNGFFGSEDGEAASFQALIVKMTELVRGGNEIETTLSDLSAQDPILRRYLAPLFLDTIHSKARSLLDQKRPENGLRLLSQIDHEKRTPTTHALLAESLKQLAPASRVLVEAPKITDFIVKVASKDPNVREAYFVYLGNMFHDRISKALIAEAIAVCGLLSQVRPDPNSLNDSLRIEGALALLKAGKKNQAYEILDTVQTGIPLLARLQIGWLKIYLQRVLVMIVLGGTALLLLALKYLPRIAAATTRAKEMPEEEEEPETERPVFVSSRGRAGGVPHEYLDILYEFELDASASLKDLKTAYRHKIKDIHPDHCQASQKDTTEFLRIKDLYEKALDIRKRLGLD